MEGRGGGAGSVRVAMGGGGRSSGDDVTTERSKQISSESRLRLAVNFSLPNPPGTLD